MNKEIEVATLAGGCFWCTEAIYKNIKGIISVVPGYSGGDTPHPTYEEVSKGNTNHAESIQIEFDPNIISFEKILEIFFATHDPTTQNRQGADTGTQYRSIVFYRNNKQKEIAEEVVEKLEKDNVYKKPIVTEIVLFKNFYEAEDYHKNYYENHKNSLYCSLVINPKLSKLRKLFPKELE